MILRAIPLFAALLAVSACGAPMPNGQGGKGGARSGQQIVTLGGADFVAEVQPGNAGLVISKAGATAVTGQTVRVTRSGSALGAGDGKLAKQVAMAACGQAGGAFNGQAVGRVVAMGVWAFEGGCA
jgi:hypothetical protein